jgi:hypothetical protein
MKKIYEFKLNSPIKTKEAIKKEVDGKEIEVLEEVIKDNYLTYFLAKPSIQLIQEAELYYESIFAECVRRGIMSHPQVRKRMLNDGGVLSEEQKKQYNDLWEQFFNKRVELNKLNEKPEDNKEKLIILNKEITDVLIKLQDFEEKNTTVYDHTAESIAKNRTTLWYMLNLSYQEINGKDIAIFGPGTIEDKLKIYDDFDKREDPSEIQLIQKFLLITTLWHFNRAGTKEDFDSILKLKEEKDKQEAQK